MTGHKTQSEPILMAAPSTSQDEVIDQVAEVLRSGQLREGRFCRQFEEEFAAQVGARYAVTVNSGTAALHVAYLSLLQPGDEVLLPSFTFIATASMLRAMGAVPVFCDVDPRTFTLDAKDAERRITPRTRAVVPVHLFGNSCDIEAMQALAERHSLKIIWDGAQSHGTRYRGRDIGSFPEAVSYSFYPSKSMTTGEGGMLATSNAELREEWKLLRSHGQTEPYLHTRLGFNYRMTEISAVLGLSQLGQLEGFVRRRRENAAFLSDGLQGLGGVVIPAVAPHAEHAFSQYSILLEGGLAARREEFRGLLQEDGVSTAVYYPKPVHQQPVFSDMEPVRLPVTEDLAARIVSLPIHPGLQKKELVRIVDVVSKAVERLG